MPSSPYHPWLHRYAVVTVCVALLLTCLMGALVTTKDAGMAFPDYPTSDGYNMFTYPWLRSVGAKFLEHGHRLAGIVIGLFSIGLAGLTYRWEQRRWVVSLSFIALAAVITQGLLGGQRVLLDARGLAFIHGSFAALVLALFASIALVTSRSWHDAQAGRASLPGVIRSSDGQGKSFYKIYRQLRVLSLVTCTAIFAQYVLGGLLRHQGLVLYEHLGFAFIVLGLVAFLCASVLVSGECWLTGPAIALGVLVVLQLVLGAGAWITKFGFGDAVAVYGSAAQVWLRTSHVLVGMSLFMTSVVLALRIARLNWLARGPLAGQSAVTLEQTLKATGGAP